VALHTNCCLHRRDNVTISVYHKPQMS